jgi:hypothetical protein
MMIDHIWTVVCSASVVDRNTNNISLFNVIEQIRIPAHYQPDSAVAIPLDVSTLWSRHEIDTPSQERARLSLLSPSNEELRQQDFEIDLRESARHRSRIHFNVLPVGGHGKHVFRVELWNEQEAEWECVADIPVWVEFVPEEAEEAAT